MLSHSAFQLELSFLSTSSLSKKEAVKSRLLFEDVCLQNRMTCNFNYLVESVVCSGNFITLKRHSEDNIEIIFTECGNLPENIFESPLKICTSHLQISCKEITGEAEGYIAKYPSI